MERFNTGWTSTATLSLPPAIEIEYPQDWIDGCCSRIRRVDGGVATEISRQRDHWCVALRRPGFVGVTGCSGDDIATPALIVDNGLQSESANCGRNAQRQAELFGMR